MRSLLQAKLVERKRQGLYRTRSIRQSAQGSKIVIDKNSYLSFCSNDYLGLSNHPTVIASFKKAVKKYGVGSGASAVLGGYTETHAALESELAEYLGYEKTLVFSTGYMANLGIITSLLGRFDTLYADKLNHASLIDGGLLCRAKVERYPHVDCLSLQKRIKKSNTDNGKIIITEGVFSMGGNIAPIKQLSEIAKLYNAHLIVDDAHGIGVLGDKGRGTLEHLGLPASTVTVLMGTFSKSFGCFGAFVAGSEGLIETLIQEARSYIYTTALPAAIVEAVRSSLRIIQQESHRRVRLQLLIQRFQKGAKQLELPFVASNTPIQSLVIGNPHLVSVVGKQLESKGILVGVIRSPTVPKKTDRLRVTITAAHTEQQIDCLLEALAWSLRSIPKP